MNLYRGNRSSKRSLSRLAVTGFAIAVVAGTAAALAGPLYRGNLLDLGEAFTLLRWAVWCALAACALSIPGLIQARSLRNVVLALAGLGIGATTFWIPYSQQRLAREVPAIHDITTDTGDPPEFRAVLPLRPDSANSLEYGGEDLAAQQRNGYPDIVPLETRASEETVFEAAAAAARELGWRIVDESPEEGRLEAVDTTFWFGFRDDVVVRITGTENGTRVDVRSVSRVGFSDVGKNAARIRAFLTELKSRL